MQIESITNEMRTIILSVLFLITTTQFSTMAQEPTSSIKDLKQLIQTIENKYAPDKRVVVFFIEATELDAGVMLKGETSSQVAYKELLDKARKKDLLIKDSIRILPDKVIGDKKWGVIYNSVADLRNKPAYSSEMVSQVLLGMPVRIIDKSGSWLRIQTPEGYIGWMSGSVQKLDQANLKEYLKKPKIVVTSLYGRSYSQADNQSQSVSDIVVGNILNVDSKEDNFYKVTYPDGRKAYVETQNAKELNNWLNEINFSGESIVETAKQLMGIPYVWGGTSAKGLDCSGFTKMVYWLHGLIIARDASQQIKYGVEVDNDATFADAELGDLLFFGEKRTEDTPKEKVVHVGIYIGNKQFIHASDYIHINSFDPESEYYDENNANRYLRTIRYIGCEDTQGITPIQLHPYYTMLQ